MIQMFGVSKSYGPNCTALEEISLGITRGDFVFLTGPSGAGKTTLLRLLIAAEPPTRGQIIVNGRNLSRLRPAELSHYRRQLGIIFQQSKFLSHRTVFDNVAITLQAQGIPNKVVKKRTWETLQWAGLEEKKEAYPARLSEGERQKVAVARALVDSPLILIADEPTGNLDEKFAAEIYKLFEEINRRGTTILFATHARQLAERSGRRAIVLRQGQIVESR
ncbi:MAG: ATP-binding cassette domain-containing protein [Candidatus Tectomicrobia bacterium]|uniref:Cell division ATP-binding protein FtsE n=1 Tax=Tectimicrobiota bacterium TaxID=2528274 RepID=A0A932M165_UNCTE|nr:ATP-binding cassette domain-containing protein [Candidatus Tectomicrobia bacterium]